MEKHELDWFKQRIGKRVFRTESSCKCDICNKVYENGLIVMDEYHADYLFYCQNQLDLFYFDEKPKKD